MPGAALTPSSARPAPCSASAPTPAWRRHRHRGWLVTRQTVYAHFPTRDALIAALLYAAGAETVAAMDAARLDTVPPADALRQFLDISRQLIRLNPHLLGPALTRNPPGSNDSHHAGTARLEQINLGEASAPWRLRQHTPCHLLDCRHPRTRPRRRRNVAAGRLTTSKAATMPWTARCDCAAPQAPAVRRGRQRHVVGSDNAGVDRGDDAESVLRSSAGSCSGRSCPRRRCPSGRSGVGVIRQPFWSGSSARAPAALLKPRDASAERSTLRGRLSVNPAERRPR